MGRVLPILFNGDMVRAILDGRKTVTRRAVKGYIPEDAIWGYTIFTPKGHISCRGTFGDGYGEKFFKLPCQNGDILYVRETWSHIPCIDCRLDEAGICDRKPVTYEDRYSVSEGCFIYRGDYPEQDRRRVCWHPSIHMPKQAARIWLKVTDVRVERLQDITPEQIIREGATGFDAEHLAVLGEHYDIPFAAFWDSTIKEADLDQYGWKANPWVWVIEFERCKKPEPCIIKGIGPASDKRPCIGYQKSKEDDEPCEMCKGCKWCDGEEAEGMIWQSKKQD